MLYPYNETTFNRFQPHPTIVQSENKHSNTLPFSTAPTVLSEAAAARYLGVAEITMRMWRTRDRARVEQLGYLPKAPPWYREGNGIRYAVAGLHAWLKSLPQFEGVPQFPDNRRHSHKRHFEARQPTQAARRSA